MLKPKIHDNLQVHSESPSDLEDSEEDVVDFLDDQRELVEEMGKGDPDEEEQKVDVGAENDSADEDAHGREKKKKIEKNASIIGPNTNTSKTTTFLNGKPIITNTTSRTSASSSSTSNTGASSGTSSSSSLMSFWRSTSSCSSSSTSLSNMVHNLE